MRMVLAPSLILAALAAVGCNRGKKAPDCKAAASAYAALVKKQVDADTGTDATRRAQALSLIPNLKEEMARECEAKNWSEATRRCIAEAKGRPDLERCMTAAPAQGTAGPAGQPAPATGDPPATRPNPVRTGPPAGQTSGEPAGR